MTIGIPAPVSGCWVVVSVRNTWESESLSCAPVTSSLLWQWQYQPHNNNASSARNQPPISANTATLCTSAVINAGNRIMNPNVMKSCEKSLTPASYLEKTPLVSRLWEEAGLGILWNLKDLKSPHQESVSKRDFSWASAEILLMGLCLKERILERELSKFHRFFDSLACPPLLPLLYVSFFCKISFSLS